MIDCKADACNTKAYMCKALTVENFLMSSNLILAEQRPG